MALLPLKVSLPTAHRPPPGTAVMLANPDQAEIIVLRVVAGLGTAEVARLVGKSPGAVRVAAHRGLRRLAGLASLTDVTV